MTTGTWRVVVDDGDVREVPVRVEGAWMFVGAGAGPQQWSASLPPRFAVASSAVSKGWRVREILAPGEATAAERVAAETARCAGVVEAQVDRRVIVEGPVEDGALDGAFDGALDSGVPSVMTGIEETLQGLIGRTVRIVVEVLPQVTP
jgi:hypothetical protein